MTLAKNIKFFIYGSIIVAIIFGGIKLKKCIHMEETLCAEAVKTGHLTPTNIQYQYDLAILNKSFVRDVDRSVNLYRSFEQYFVGAEHTPFFVVVPASDLELFKQKFNDAKNEKQIKTLPKFFTDQEIFQKCQEPHLSDGVVGQQIVKLCFGTLAIAKNYIALDSDTYFTKQFNPATLFTDGVIQTAAWKLDDAKIQEYSEHAYPFITSELSNSWLDNMKLIKHFFGDRNNDYYGFVNASLFISSDAIHRMKNFMTKAGITQFAKLLSILPFEGQWYGEYVLQHENLYQHGGLFRLINSISECAEEDGGTHSYGIWFQSVDYDYTGVSKAVGINPNVIYKRPAHCK